MLQTLEDAMQRVMKYFTQSEREQVESWSSETDRENAFRRQWSMKEAFVKARGDGLGFQLNRAEFHLDSEDSEKSSDFDDDDDDEEDDAGNDEDGETAPSGTDTNDEDEEATLQLRRVSLQRKNSNSLSKLASANGVNNGTSNGGGGLKRTSSTHSVVQDGENRPSWALRTQPLGDSHIVSVATGPPQDVVDAHGVFKSTLTQLDDDKPAEEWREQYLSYDRPPFELVTIADVMPQRLRRKYEETGGEVL
jgi:4'-phosphopantetheinyl transferase